MQVIAKEYEGILKDAAEIRKKCGDAVYIKVPVTPDGLAAIKTLKAEGYKITATAIYTTFQGLLAIEAGADYLAPYYNRMENLNIDSDAVISSWLRLLSEIILPVKYWRPPLKMLPKSIELLLMVPKPLQQVRMFLQQPLLCRPLLRR